MLTFYEIVAMSYAHIFAVGDNDRDVCLHSTVDDSGHVVCSHPFLR